MMAVTAKTIPTLTPAFALVDKPLAGTDELGVGETFDTLDGVTRTVDTVTLPPNTVVVNRLCVKVALVLVEYISAADVASLIVHPSTEN